MAKIDFFFLNWPIDKQMDSSKDAFEIYGLNLNIFYTCANNKKNNNRNWKAP